MAAEVVRDSDSSADRSVHRGVVSVSVPRQAWLDDSVLDVTGHLTRTAGVTSPAGRPSAMKLSLIMATYNEEQTIAQAINEVLSTEFPCAIELIIVDDGSTDQTAGILSQVSDPRVVVTKHQANQGKGAALLTGLALASGTHVIPFDADLEYAAQDIIRMLEPLLRGRCTVVYGVRLFGYNTVYRSYWYALGNRWLTRFTNVLYGSCISDLHTCLKLMPVSLMRNLTLRESRFGLDTELTAALLRRGERPFEVPVSYFSRLHSEGKKINWRDAVACLWILLRVRVQRDYRRVRAGSRRAEDHVPANLQGGKVLAAEAADDYAVRVAR